MRATNLMLLWRAVLGVLSLTGGWGGCTLGLLTVWLEGRGLRAEVARRWAGVLR